MPFDPEVFADAPISTNDMRVFLDAQLLDLEAKQDF
jgi:hypothetical protein